MANAQNTWYYGNAVDASSITGYYNSKYWAAVYYRLVDNGSTVTVELWGNVWFQEYSGHTNSSIYIWGISPYNPYNGNLAPSGNNGWINGNDSYGKVIWTYTKTSQAYNVSATVAARVGPVDTSSVTIDITIPAISSYTVKYYKNDGTGVTSSYAKQANVPHVIEGIGSWQKASTYSNGYKITFQDTSRGTLPTTLTQTNTTSYSFTKWNTKSDGTGTNYSPGYSYTTNANIDLYAIWKGTTTKGSISCPIPRPWDGYIFVGWGESSTSTSPVYTGGDEFIPTANKTYYAIWRQDLGQNNDFTLYLTKPKTWRDLINNQSDVNNPLNNVGGKTNSWGIDSSNYVTLFGSRIKIRQGTSLLNVISSTKPIRGADYYYYI